MNNKTSLPDTLMFFNADNNKLIQKEKTQTHRLKRIFIISLFGSIIFIVNMFLPPPINYMFIALQAVLLALSGIFIKKVGATYAGAIGGLLTALCSPGLGIFTFIASTLFGTLIDLTIFIFKIKGTPQGVNRNRLITATTISTMIIGIITYTLSTTGNPNMPFLIPRSPILDIMVLFMGPATGATAGYAAAYLWNKYLKNIALTL